MNLPSAILIYATGALAAWWNIPQPKQLPPIVIEKKVVEEKIAYYGLTVVPRGFTRQFKKLYTDRIMPAVAETVQGKIAPERYSAAKPMPVAKRVPCKPGRHRNAQGLCGRWSKT